MGIQHKVIWLDENNGRKWPLTLLLSGLAIELAAQTPRRAIQAVA